MPYRLGTSIPAGTPVTTSETSVAALSPGLADPTVQVLVRADCVLTGGASTTSITLQVRRGATPVGSTPAGASLASATFTVAGAVTVSGNLAIPPDPGGTYDGTGYCLTAQAAGGAGTCGPGMLESEITYQILGFG